MVVGIGMNSFCSRAVSDSVGLIRFDSCRHPVGSDFDRANERDARANAIERDRSNCKQLVWAGEQGGRGRTSSECVRDRAVK